MSYGFVFVSCPVQECEWFDRELSQGKATDALVRHCLDKHQVPEELIRRYRRYWINDMRAYHGWSCCLDEVDKFTGFQRRDSGLRTISQRRMEACLGKGGSK